MMDIIELDDNTQTLISILHRRGNYSFFQRINGDDKCSYWRKCGKRIAFPVDIIENYNFFFGVNPVTMKVTDEDRAKYPKLKDDRISTFVGPKNNTIAALNCVYAEFDGKDWTHPSDEDIERIFQALRANPDKASANDATLRLEALGKAKEAIYATDPAHFKAQALHHVKSLLTQPSVIIDSGGGYQGYFLFADTFVITSDADRERAASLQKRWVAFCEGDPSVHDIRRILRVPGSRNHKKRYAPDYPLIDFIKRDFDLRYSFEQLEALLPPEEPKPVRQTAAPAYSVNGEGSIIDMFNATHGIADVLLAHGYTWAGKDRMNRPGSEDSKGVVIYADENESYHHSGGDPLHNGYRMKPFNVVCKLDYNDDPKAALKALTKDNPKAKESARTGEEPEQNTTEQLSAFILESYPYDIQGGRMGEWRQRTVKGEPEEYFAPIADFWAKITGENTDEYGERTFVISGEGVRGGRFSFEIPALQFGDGGKLAAALEAHVGAFDPIQVGQQKHVGAAIKRLTSGQLARSLIYTRTGWASDNFLIPGREPENTEIRLARKLPYAFNYKADLAKGLEAFAALLEFMGPEAGPVIMASLMLPPLAHPAGWRNERYATFIKGRSGTHKTSTLQAAMCTYGADFARDEYLLKFGEGATRSAIMALATQAGDLPLPIDNYKPSTGGGASDFTNLIHNILEGGEKERLDRGARLKETKPIFTWPVCTGEDLPSDDPASLARILIVTFDIRTRGKIEHLTKAQGLAAHLPAVGAAWIDWLQSDAGKAVAAENSESMPTQRNRMAEQLIAQYPKMVNPYRIATNITINQLCWTTLCEHPAIGNIAKRHHDNHAQGIARIASNMASYTATSLEANRYVQSLKELITGGRLILLEKGVAINHDARNIEHVIGWNDGNGGAYILPELTFELVKRYGGDDFGGITRNAINEQLDQLGYIASKDKNQLTKNVKVQGRTNRVLHLAPGALNVECAGIEVPEIVGTANRK